MCMPSLCRGHANLLCILPILVYVLPKRALCLFLFYHFIRCQEEWYKYGFNESLFSFVLSVFVCVSPTDSELQVNHC